MFNLINTVPNSDSESNQSNKEFCWIITSCGTHRSTPQHWLKHREKNRYHSYTHTITSTPQTPLQAHMHTTHTPHTHNTYKQTNRHFFTSTELLAFSSFLWLLMREVSCCFSTSTCVRNHKKTEVTWAVITYHKSWSNKRTTFNIC